MGSNFLSSLYILDIGPMLDVKLVKTFSQYRTEVSEQRNGRGVIGEWVEGKGLMEHMVRG